MSVQTSLLGAASVIEDRGWTRDAYVDDDGCVDIVGAIVVAVGGKFKYDDDGKPEDFVANTEVYAALAAVDDVINQPVEPPEVSLHPVMVLSAVEWNDTEGRTQGEVLSVLRAAAKLVAA